MFDFSSSWLQVCVLGTLGSCCSLVGVFLIYRQMTMLANALSHTVLLGVALGLIVSKGLVGLFPSLLPPVHVALEPNFASIFLGSLFSGLLTSYTHHRLTHLFGLRPEASIGMILSGFFALGILLLTLIARNTHIGIESVMGNIDAISQKELVVLTVIWLSLITLCTLFFRSLVASSFDRNFCSFLGLNTPLIDTLILIMTSATVMAGLRAVGAILVLSFLVGLPLCAKRLVTVSEYVVDRFMQVFSKITPSYVKRSLSGESLRYLPPSKRHSVQPKDASLPQAGGGAVAASSSSQGVSLQSVQGLILISTFLSWVVAALAVGLSDLLAKEFGIYLSTGGLCSSVIFMLMTLLRIFPRVRSHLIPHAASQVVCRHR